MVNNIVDHLNQDLNASGKRSNEQNIDFQKCKKDDRL